MDHEHEQARPGELPVSRRRLAFGLSKRALPPLWRQSWVVGVARLCGAEQGDLEPSPLVYRLAREPWGQQWRRGR